MIRIIYVRMYICLCNGIKDSQISSAIAKGSASVAQVYRHCGSRPRCGKCVDFVRQQIKSCGKG